jgi:hypothetical protein
MSVDEKHGWALTSIRLLAPSSFNGHFMTIEKQIVSLLLWIRVSGISSREVISQKKVLWKEANVIQVVYTELCNDIVRKLGVDTI